MNLKYTEEQEKELIEGYLACDTQDDREMYILHYMHKHSKTSRSVIAKLSKLKIYKARPKESKVTGGKPETKEQMVIKIANKLGMNIDKLNGLEKSPKLTLLNLLKRLSS